MTRTPPNPRLLTRLQRIAHACAMTLGVACLAGLLQAPAVASTHGSLRQEAFFTVGVQGSPQAGPASDRATVVVGLRLEGNRPLADDLAFQAVLTPQLQWTPLTSAPVDTVTIDAGLSEAYLKVPGASWDLSLGLQRWSLGELRLAPILARDTPQGFADPRGVWGARATGFLHPWRVELGVTAESSDVRKVAAFSAGPVVVGAMSIAASLRYDAGVATLTGHALADVTSPEAERPLAIGASGSTSLASLVVYGDAWWLVHAASLRGGLGLTGYAGDVLWTVEAAWAAPSKSPFATGSAAAARPTVRAQASAPLSLDQSIDLQGGVAWPSDPVSGARGTQLDGSLSWTWNRAEDALRIAARITHRAGMTPGDVTTVSVLWTWSFYD